MPKYLVTAHVLRIRSGSGTSHAIIGALLRNDIVQGDEINGDWIHGTSADNKTGWEHASLHLGEVDNHVICLGGNQSDAVWISVYHKKYITSYRVP